LKTAVPIQSVTAAYALARIWRAQRLESPTVTEPMVVVSAKLRLIRCDMEQSKCKLNELNARRKDKQPLEYASAGSTFKRPEGYYAGALIEQAGLMGHCIGGAQVSEKHAGFIINKGEASADDVLELIEDVQRRVKADCGVALETEVKVVGER